MLSMLQQMLHDDKEADVREAVVRSLGLLMGFISDPDKYQQVWDYQNSYTPFALEATIFCDINCHINLCNRDLKNE